jgi:Kef-type K+ transport system membrane component KefB
MLQLLIREWPNVLSLLAGLIAIKTLITTALGTRVGLTLQESIRIGLLLSQGGEFGFVVFSLANRSVFFFGVFLFCCSCFFNHLIFGLDYLD